MKTKRSYGTVDVEKFDAKAVLPMLTTDCIVAIDVAKTKFVGAAIATASGDPVKLVKFEYPRGQTGVFLEQLSILSEAGQKPTVVMEPTGTYGDAVRYQCHQLGLTVHMMPPKHTHDFAEVFDGVPPRACTTRKPPRCSRSCRRSSRRERGRRTATSDATCELGERRPS